MGNIGCVDMSDYVEKIVNYGVLGAVCVWFMFRLETIIGKFTASLDDNTKVLVKICAKLGIEEEIS